MDSNRSLKKGELIEQFTTTFGIEVEFCTHNSDVLSYTHIEVCQIKDGIHEWKIETDSGYTLELVSPILHLENHQKANACKQYLVIELYKISKGSQSLGNCINQIQALILESSKTFKFQYWNLKTQMPELSTNNFSVDFIDQESLIQELNYHNWDDTTKLQDLESTKKAIGKKNPKIYLDDLNKIIIKASEKHGGIPNPQLNLPMTLPAYVWYSAYVKEPTAWRRLLLLSDNAFLQEWRENRSNKIRGVNGAVVQVSQLNIAFKEKVKGWFKYWFWLVSMRELAELGLQKLDEKYIDTHPWRIKLNSLKIGNTQSIQQSLLGISFKTFELLVEITNQAPYKGLPSDIKINIGGNLPINHYWDTATTEKSRLLSSLLYLTVQKLISGALGVLSEEVQLEIQKLIVEDKLQSQKAVTEISKTKSTKFREYHSFLKDLTPLWFKGSLCDVLMTVSQSEQVDFNDLCRELVVGINAVSGANFKKIVETNLAFLEIIHSRSNLKSSFDFKGFSQDLIPDIDVFIKQYDQGKSELVAILQKAMKNRWELRDYIYENNQANKNEFLERTNVPPWEGRWDTLKPPIGEGVNTEFLVEHRNN